MTKEKLEELILLGATRKCSKCNEVLPVTNFHLKADKNTNHYRFNSPCKFCSNFYRNKNYYKAHRLKVKYNLSQEDYNLKLKAQKYSCAICNIHRDDYLKDFSVDHCHKTGKVRSLLCTQCNSGIGFFRENINNMEKAIAYIKKHKNDKKKEM